MKNILLLIALLPSILIAQPNNGCDNAVVLVPVPYGTCNVGSIIGSNALADWSSTMADPSCDPGDVTQFQDVWYRINNSFLSVSTQLRITLTPLGGMTDHAFTLYRYLSGCEGLPQSYEIVCRTAPSGTVVVDLPPDSFDMLLRVYSNDEFGFGGLFSLCVEGNQAIPWTGDERGLPRPLQVRANGSCVPVAADNTLATSNGDWFDPPCDSPPSTNYRDQWYTFNSGQNETVSITVTPGTATSLSWSVINENNTSYACVTGSSATVPVSVPPLSDLTLRVWTNIAQGSPGTYTVCVEGADGSGPSAPANDVPTGATLITAGTSCTPINGSVANATDDLDEVGCDNDGDKDVWYRFVATSSQMVVRVVGTAQFDPAISFMRDPLFLDPAGQYCVNATGNGGIEKIAANGLDVGRTYFVRIEEMGAGVPATTGFSICVTSAPLNDECSDAQVVPMTAACTPISVNSTMATASDLLFSQSCYAQTQDWDDDLWFRFTATSGHARIVVDGNGSPPGGYDPIVDLGYENCFNSLLCVNETGPGGTEVIDFDGLVQGGSYLVRVFDQGEGEPTSAGFTICVQDVIAMSTELPARGHESPRLLLVDGRLFLELSEALPSDGSWEVLDMRGARVVDGSVAELQPGRTNLASAPSAPGIYLFRMNIEGLPWSTRFSTH